MVALVFPIDRILDMTRTAINVTGDAAVATLIAQSRRGVHFAGIKPVEMSSYRFKQRKMRWINLYPPYLGAGIRFKGFSDDGYACHVEMKLRWWNKNLFNTHFGGSIYAMCDPWFVLLCSIS